MSVNQKLEVVLRGACNCQVFCDECHERMCDGDPSFCGMCRTLPDSYVDPRDAAGVLRAWSWERRHDLTEIERELLDHVADQMCRP